MYGITYYTSSGIEDSAEVIRKTCTDLGFEVERVPTEQTNANPGSSVFVVSDNGWDFEIRFDMESTGQEPASALSITRTPWFSDPQKHGVDDNEYQRRVDRLFELICQLAMAFEIEYAPMMGQFHARKCWPTDRPLAENIEELPIFGIYSESILKEFGGLQAMFDQAPWYVADLPSGHTIVIQEDFPWNRKEWTPPEDAAFLETVTFPDSGEYTQSGSGFEDPFAAFETDAIGTDLCVPREKIGPEFRNEDLELVRVRVDEERNLRRLETDAFVRNIVDDDPDNDAAFMMAMLEEIPADTTGDGLMVSALLHEAVPPAFVQLDDPNGETIVTKVDALDIDVSKIELLISLGQITQQRCLDNETLREVKQLLAKLEHLDDLETIEDYIRDRLT